MLKRLLRVAMVTGVLLAAYASYVRIFAVVQTVMKPDFGDVPIIPPEQMVVTSGTAKEATDLAGLAFGPNHWSTRALLRYYSSERGYWIYTDKYLRERDGKRVQFEPFALIWRSRDGRTLKTLLADKAVVDFDEPFDAAVKPGAKSGHVVHASISGNIYLRDDKGTPENNADDLTVHGMTFCEFDEKELQIKSESPVIIQDRDMMATGEGLRIELWPQKQPGRSGFNGAKTAWLLRKVHIVVKNAGRGGILPGTDRSQGGQQAPTPLDVTCAGAMRIDLPEPALPAKAGQPPAPPAPTFVHFTRNVRVIRGTDRPDQLDCDELFLTLMPAPKTARPQAQPANPSAVDPSDGPLTELTLRRAEATGHAVWLQSEAQDLQARGNQLIHEKLMPAEPDKTYFRADQGTMLLVNKIERFNDGPNLGKIRAIDTLRTVDVTIFETGQQNQQMTVVARGPGWMETRSRKDGPVERSAQWQDRLIMRTEGQAEKLRRVLTLYGMPKVSDPESGTLTADTQIVAWLKPKADAQAGAPRPQTPGPASGEAFQIESVVALDNVLLAQGPSRSKPQAQQISLTARKRLDAMFQPPPQTQTPPPAPGTATAAPAVASQTPAQAPAPAEAQNPGTPAAEAPKKPAEPAIKVDADWVWARVLQKPAQGSSEKGSVELLEARLREDVAFHQDPGPGKTVGTDLTGNAADVLGQGQGLYQFRVHGNADTPAKASNDEFSIEGPVLALDQTANFAWVEGAGKLTQMVSRALLNDGGLVPTVDVRPDAAAARGARPRPAQADKSKVPMTITWETRMTFHGQTPQRAGENQPGPAKAEFFTNVIGQTEDANLACEHLEVFMDKPVAFNRPQRAGQRSEAAADPAQPEPKPQIAFVRLRSPQPKHVVVVNTKRDPETREFLERQRVEGNDVTYNKVTGQFNVEGAGLVRLYGRQGQSGAMTTPGLSRDRDGTPSQPRVTPTASRQPQPGRSPTATASTTKPAVRKDAARSGPAAKPLELTRIKFRDGMRGRFGSGQDTSTAAPRQADFATDVEALHGPVKDENADLDPDRPPTEYVFLTSQFLRVVSEPPPPGSKESARNFLNALENANATTRDKQGRESTVQGDQVTYDSQKGLFYVYALPGREVLISQQTGPGQPPSVSSAASYMFNHKTGEGHADAPQSFVLFDAKKAIRAPEAKPAPPEKPKTARRKDPKLTPRSDKDRRGFNGR